ncbi:hypothetical protein GALMADRAFT_810384 [Galerina marginata CBS 339.88]|uniref:Uncharacterized protein n=1 Tax=Galerina marginata (strain CBS 339.88) TaxID=685588 RepID=A0A067SLC9_GALM3|nr:hypothetical protein GALMADRAFT_810384 [Galerina marginata CBS 339.88]
MDIQSKALINVVWSSCHVKTTISNNASLEVSGNDSGFEELWRQICWALKRY